MANDSTEDASGLEPDFAAEYETLLALKDTVLENADYYKPFGLYDDFAGQKVSFETTDLDGNVVTSEELFASHDVTMVNVWATWCGACLGELSELEEINARLADKNAVIVGIVGDGEDDETAALAKSQLEEAGCTYLCLRPFDGWEEFFPMTYWPTSFFFDSTGQMVGSPVVGADVEGYEDHIDGLLADMAGETVLETVTKAPKAKKGYVVHVVDQKGNPVQGAMVQFCTDDTCELGKTDENGVASFDDPEGVYDVHILKVPEGYQKDDNEYRTSATYGSLEIVLQAN